MPFAVELYFDPSTEESIREAWKAIDEAGISDSMPKGGTGRMYRLGFANTLNLTLLRRNFQVLLRV